MLNDYLAKESSLQNLSYHANTPLAPYTTFGIGGPADYLVIPHNEETLVSCITFFRQNHIRFFVCGNGSNLLFDDKGYRGVVLLTNGIRKITFTDTMVEASCGSSLIGLSSQAAKHALSGLEFACGIPGTVGGALFMNAGAHGGELADIVLSSRYLDEGGVIREITQHDFSYRHSIYQDIDGIILSCCLNLRYGNTEEIRATMAGFKNKREATQPIKEKSAGSVFRRQEGIIPAALIDQAGLKGTSVGDACVSCKHAGFIVNHGNASAKDVLTLIELIREKIHAVYGVTLIPEIRYIRSE